MTASPPEHPAASLGTALDRLLGLVTATALFAMMTLTTIDVVMRYVFGAPIRGAFELTELLLVTVIFSGLPLVSRDDQHVAADLVDRFLGAAARRSLATTVHLLAAAAFAGVAWLAWGKAARLAANADTTASLQVALAPFAYLMAVMLAVTAMVHAVKALRGALDGAPGEA